MHKEGHDDRGLHPQTDLVIVSELLACLNGALSKDDNMLGSLDLNDTTRTVGVAGVVDEPTSIAHERGVDDDIVVNAEHVATDATTVVIFFAFILKNGGRTKLTDKRQQRQDGPPTEETLSANPQ